MKFFVPFAKDDAEADRVYGAIAAFVSAPIDDQRVARLEWTHKGQRMSGEIGKPLPPYYGTGDEPVLALFDCGNVYKICTANRGGLRGDPVLASRESVSQVVYFET